LIKTKWATVGMGFEPEYFMITRQLVDIEEQLLKLPGIDKWKLAGLDSLWWSRRIEYPWAIITLDIDKNDNILDAGCGFTFFPYYMAHYAGKVTGMDINPEIDDMVAFINKNVYEPVKFNVGDVISTPYPTNTFDKTTCISVIEHIGKTNVEKALIELCRITKTKVVITMDVVINDSERGHMNIYDLSDIGDKMGFDVPDRPASTIVNEFHGDIIAVLCMEISI